MAVKAGAVASEILPPPNDQPETHAEGHVRHSQAKRGPASRSGSGEAGPRGRSRLPPSSVAQTRSSWPPSVPLSTDLKVWRSPQFIVLPWRIIAPSEKRALGFGSRVYYIVEQVERS